MPGSRVCRQHGQSETGERTGSGHAKHTATRLLQVWDIRMNKLLQHYQGKMISRVVYITRELGQVALILFLMKFLCFDGMEWLSL